MIQINKNVDAAFYTELWCEEGGGLDQIEKQAHNQGEKRQKDTGTAVDLSVNYEDYIACKDIPARYNA